MTIAECDKRNIAVLKNAVAWANYRECSELDQSDVPIVAEYLNMNVPRCIYHFVSSENPNQCNADGAYKSIFSFLDKLKDKIANGGLDKFVRE